MMDHLAVVRVAVALAAVAAAVVLPTSHAGVGTALATQGVVPIGESLPARPTGLVSADSVLGTVQDDLDAFAEAFNAERLMHHLDPIPPGNFRYDSCMEQRLFWIAGDPSTSVASAWGHSGSTRSDGVPPVGCDGNLAGGLNNTGATVAIKWWDSLPHRVALYKPIFEGDVSSVCIFFAMTHGGVPDEPQAFTRAAARWATC